MTRTFTDLDKVSGACALAEVGLPWEPRWTFEDACRGRCTVRMVGSRNREVPWDGEETQVSAEYDDDPPPQNGLDATLARFHADPEAFIASSPPGVVVRILSMLEGRSSSPIPDLTSTQAWSAWAAQFMKQANAREPRAMATIPLLILLLLEAAQEAGGSPSLQAIAERLLAARH